MSRSRLVVLLWLNAAMTLGCASPQPNADQPGQITRLSPQDLARLTPPPNPKVPLSEVIVWSQEGASSDAIIKKLQDTGTFYNLNAQQIVGLSKQGVHQRVIDHLVEAQEKCARPPCSPNWPTATPRRCSRSNKSATAAARCNSSTNTATAAHGGRAMDLASVPARSTTTTRCSALGGRAGRAIPVAGADALANRRGTLSWRVRPASQAASSGHQLKGVNSHPAPHSHAASPARPSTASSAAPAPGRPSRGRNTSACQSRPARH